MNGKTFIDTNIFIYLYADNEREKQRISKDIINTAIECITSTQILNEISNVLIKKWRMTTDAVKTVQTDVRQISSVTYVKEDTIDRAIDLHARYGFSYYDCLMLASALENDCDIIFTEDMNNSQMIDSKLKIVNPFNKA